MGKVGWCHKSLGIHSIVNAVRKFGSLADASLGGAAEAVCGDKIRKQSMAEKYSVEFQMFE